MNSLTSPGYSAAPGATTAISGETPATEMPTTSSPGNERLIALAAPAMEDLYRQLDSPSVTVLLADSQGGVLRAIGNGAESTDGASESTACGAGKVPRQPAASRAALANRPRVPPRRIGIAAPILPPAGGMLGFVDADVSPFRRSLRGLLAGARRSKVDVEVQAEADAFRRSMQAIVIITAINTVSTRLRRP